MKLLCNSFSTYEFVYLFIWIFSALNSLSDNFKGIHDYWIYFCSLQAIEKVLSSQRNCPTDWQDLPPSLKYSFKLRTTVDEWQWINDVNNLCGGQRKYEGAPNNFISEYAAMQLWVISLLSFQALYTTSEIVSELSTQFPDYLLFSLGIRNLSSIAVKSLIWADRASGRWVVVCWPDLTSCRVWGKSLFRHINLILLLALSFILTHLNSGQFCTILSMCAEKSCKYLNFLCVCVFISLGTWN